jgi:hypothetical protein
MFALREIHQIEMTSHCNLRCKYCPSPHLARPKLHMTEANWRRSLHWVGQFRERGTQGELNIAGIGESTMHPEFVRFLFIAREVVGPGHRLLFATNGLLVTDELAKEIAPAKPLVWVSMHRPEKAGPAVQALRRVGLLAGVSADPSIAAINWAGQVDWEVSAPARQCMWVKHGWAMVLADGRVSRCCLDATGEGVFAHVDDDLDQFQTSPYTLCRTCDEDVGVPIPDSVPRRDNAVPLKFMKREAAA